MAAKAKSAAPPASSRSTKKKWRGVVLESKKNYEIEATTYGLAKKEMQKLSGMSEYTGAKQNWAVGILA